MIRTGVLDRVQTTMATTIKIFISHQKTDSALAGYAANYLSSRHGFAYYLDVIDPGVPQGVDELADHVRTRMGQCTQLLAVVSSATSRSEWVPWEIGVATEKNFPLATYCKDATPSPEFLRKWPYLKDDTELDAYANASKTAHRLLLEKADVITAATRASTTKTFYSELRARLGR